MHAGGRQLGKVGDVAEMRDEIAVALGEHLQERLLGRRAPAPSASAPLVGVQALIGDVQGLIERDAREDARAAARAADRIARTALAERRLGRREHLLALGGGRDDHELVATDPVGAAVRADDGCEAAPQAREQRIAGRVAERVVVVLEPVEVEHPDGQRLAPVERPEARLHVGEQLAPVAEPGQCVRRSRRGGCAGARGRCDAARPRRRAAGTRRRRRSRRWRPRASAPRPRRTAGRPSRARRGARVRPARPLRDAEVARRRSFDPVATSPAMRSRSGSTAPGAGDPRSGVAVPRSRAPRPRRRASASRRPAPPLVRSRLGGGVDAGQRRAEGDRTSARPARCADRRPRPALGACRRRASRTRRWSPAPGDRVATSRAAGRRSAEAGTAHRHRRSAQCAHASHPSRVCLKPPRAAPARRSRRLRATSHIGTWPTSGRNSSRASASASRRSSA